MGDSFRVLPDPHHNTIRSEWEHNVGKYPDIVSVKMSDGTYVRYRIDIPQPNPHVERMHGNLERMDSLVQGYPPDVVGRHEKRP